MAVLETYIEGLRTGDVDKVASVFAENALFDDQAPRAMGMDALVFNNRDAIRQNFSALLANGGLDVQDVCICGNAVRYDIVLGADLIVKALGLAKIENDQIVEYRVSAPM